MSLTVWRERRKERKGEEKESQFSTAANKLAENEMVPLHELIYPSQHNTQRFVFSSTMYNEFIDLDGVLLYTRFGLWKPSSGRYNY
jgi:hypothetical protein